MAENNTDFLLRNINEKLRNRNIFTWKMVFGWLISIPFAAVGMFFASFTGTSSWSDTASMMAFLFLIAALVMFIANIIIGIKALQQSTKDTKK